MSSNPRGANPRPSNAARPAWRASAVAAGTSAVGSWLALMIVSAFAYRIGEPGTRAGYVWFALVLVAVALPWVVPRAGVRWVLARAGSGTTSGLAAVVAGLAVAAEAVLAYAWWAIVAAVLLGLLARFTRPAVLRLRAVLIAACVYLAATLAVQLSGGVGAGTDTLPWLAAVAGLLIIVGGVRTFFAVPAHVPDHAQGRSGIPGVVHAPIRPAWATAAVLGLAGAAAVSGQAQVGLAGQAGAAFIVFGLVVGAGFGKATGGRILPGLSRPRFIAVCLLAAGILAAGFGVALEVTASALLAGLVGWLAAAAASAHGGRRGAALVPIGAGGFVALGLAATGMTTTADISAAVSWTIAPIDAALLILGGAGILAGIVALLTLDPRRTRGLGTEIATAWTAEAATEATTDSDRGPAMPEAETGMGDRTRRARSGPGLFIAFEGGDGAGKTTQTQAIAAWLASEYAADVARTREPGGTPTGMKLREVLLSEDGVDPRTEALLFAADRGDHVETLIRPALADGKAVLTDRYMDSSIAYQGSGREHDRERIADLSTWAVAGLVPDVTVVLDVDPREAEARREGRGPQDHLEREPAEFHHRVRAAFLELAAAEPERYLVVRAGGDPRDVTAEIIRGLRPFAEAANLHRAERSGEKPAEPATVKSEATGPEPAAPKTTKHEATEPEFTEPETARWRPDGDDKTQVIRADEADGEAADEADGEAAGEADEADSDYRRRLREQAAAERAVRERLRQQRGGGK